MAQIVQTAIPRFGTSVPDVTVSSSTEFALAINTDYRFATTGAAAWLKFGVAAAVTATVGTAGEVLVPVGEFFFNSGAHTAVAVIQDAATAKVSLTPIVKQGA